ncbi:MAG: tetratricopeptide repeat protein [Chitinophagales bacterium]|nr:tetratricopeptide repeat protein [Chitinophagales bacterium]
MEFLKTSFMCLLVMSAMNSFAQDAKTLQTAFSNSYSHETQGKYVDALTDLKTVYSATSYECNLRYGWLYYLQGKNTESISYYQKAIDLMPAAVEPLWGLVNPLLAAEKWSEVEKTYQAILKLDPKNSTANYRLGLSNYYNKNYVQAKKYFDVVINLYPFDYNGTLMSAWTNYFLGNMSEAKVLFNKVLVITPNDSSALEGLGLIK